ncbi:protein BIG GRAIN 1-like E [Ziziphus jujuba]|uniref:Protein BIG GRAIN 1-like E n=2 Tax=Ziziphus jujuba TaxID=326968 RepID=A0A6P4B8S7_ZIZJJ|nr:protein BIG GRAIN 1-like E [Ziziphus jujuba]KAH7516126.1 hypothetical protein FEM48_Zijuj10G0102000 [Ziziphus jujuba var. spinosa]
MSITGLADPDTKIYKKSFHRRNDSGELDVFEAARYFSGYNEAAGYNGSTFTQKMMMKEDHRTWRGARISLDVPAMRSVLPHHQQSHQMVEKQIKDKKYKQPSSPGGRLASFLNSLFSQSASKKKKSKSSTQSMKDHEEESPGGRRKRRSSISHFRSSSTTDSKSIYSSSSSGFRTPPPYAQTPTKSYKEFRSYSDHKQAVSLSKCNNNNIGQVRSIGLQNHEVLDDKRERELSWLDEKFKFSNGLAEKYKNLGSGILSEKDRIWMEKFPPEENGGFRKFNDIDDGADSDSSSDLFELQNYDLGLYSNGLPVYETTNMDSIKRGTPISNAQM